MVTPLTLLTPEEVNKIIEERFTKMERKRMGVLVFNSNITLPLSAEIQNTQLSPRFSFPKITTYDDENIKCLSFPTTLTGSAAEWFNLLPTGSIKSFEQLRYKFVQKFARMQGIKKDVNSLFGMEQRDGEMPALGITVRAKRFMMLEKALATEKKTKEKTDAESLVRQLRSSFGKGTSKALCRAGCTRGVRCDGCLLGGLRLQNVRIRIEGPRGRGLDTMLIVKRNEWVNEAKDNEVPNTKVPPAG
ncbi:hypothetical protein CRG98_003681 [Punica granatum]|uniref:Retrotransposon gag domain-containing protein n=1 Tax=Punica granatum TaxID=22663 RepID=A0A2I0L5F7_PUNGR|nr:hypothetical protein CRG98_003681 [Punica granatum]